MTRDEHKDSEYLLICAILSRAVLDLFGPIVTVGTPDDQRNIRMEALRFLTDETGSWAARRSELCGLVDIDEAAMRKTVIRTLNGEQTLHAYRDWITNLDGARSLWAEHKADLAQAHSARVKAKATARARRDERAALMRELTAAAEKKYQLTTGAQDTLLDILRDGPRTIREIGFALDGELESTTIRKHLDILIEEGRVERDPPHYRLKTSSFSGARAASVPHVCVAANAG